MTSKDCIYPRKNVKIAKLRALETFLIKVNYAVVSDEPTKIVSLQESYKKMETSIHPHCNNPRKIDMGAFGYALELLSGYIVKAKNIYLQNRPENLEKVAKLIKNARRKRTMYILDECKKYFKIIARDKNISDIADIISYLIAISIEAEKMKNLIRHTDIYLKLKNYESFKETEKTTLLIELSQRFDVSYNEIYEMDKTYKGNFLKIIKDTIDNDFDELTVEFSSDFSEIDHSEKSGNWISNILKNGEIDKDKKIIFFSSDLTNIVDGLSGFRIKRKDLIFDLLNKNQELKKQAEKIGIDNPAVLNQLIDIFSYKSKEFLKEKNEYQKSTGIQTIVDTSHTGVDMQIINLAKINPELADPILLPHFKNFRSKKEMPIILNINYPFGLQAFEIMNRICGAFGDRMIFVGVTGKAGILCGNLFSIMIPSYLLPLIKEGGVYDFPNNNAFTITDLKGIATGIDIYDNGPMLTVPGTAIQNAQVLKYYQEEFDTIGLEMEGVAIMASIERAGADKLGLLRKDIATSFAYYASDNPFKHDERLNKTTFMHSVNMCRSANTILMAMIKKALILSHNKK